MNKENQKIEYKSMWKDDYLVSIRKVGIRRR